MSPRRGSRSRCAITHSPSCSAGSMQPPLTVTVAYPRSASSRRTDARSGLSVVIPLAVQLRLHDERPEDREGPRRDPRPRLPRLAVRRAPAQRHRLERRLARRLRAVVEIEAALRPRHHHVPLPEVFLVEREEAADTGPVVVDQALRVAVGVVVGGTLEHDLAAGAAARAGPAAAVQLLDHALLAEADEEGPADFPPSHGR